MQNWNIAPECVALIVYFVLILYTKRSGKEENFSQKIFYVSLWVSVLAISCNILGCLFLLGVIPGHYDLSYIVQGAYFLITPLMPGMLVIYLIYEAFADSHGHKGSAICFWIIMGLWLLYSVMVVYSITMHNGWFYSIDETTGMYIRGPVNRLAMLVSLCYIAVGIIACSVNNKHLSPTLLQLVKRFPVISLMIYSVQIFLPQVQISGSACMICSLVCYLHFQTINLTTDYLTKLPNRAMFGTYLEHLFRTKRQATVIGINIRNFKHFNQEYGVSGGDRFLCFIAQSLTHVGGNVQVFRYSGDRFALICPPLQSPETTKCIEKIKDLFQGKRYFSMLVPDVDLIVFDLPHIADDADSILNLLSYAFMQTAEENVHDGLTMTNCVTIRTCDDHLRDAIHRRDYVLSVLRDACLHNAFTYVYQPIYNMDGTFSGKAESLIRYIDEKNHISIAPSEFIPIAEASGLIGTLGRLVFETACRTIRDAKNRGQDITLSINFSTIQFYRKNFVEMIMDIITQNGVSPSQIKIEITESTFIHNYDKVCSAMQQFLDLGIGFYVDDFGTGYASFDRLMRLPFECVKFDRGLLLEAEKNPRLGQLFSSLVSCFNRLGTHVVFEGVETKAQLEMVKGFGEGYIQGFYFARPLERREFIAFLESINAKDGRSAIVQD